MLFVNQYHQLSVATTSTVVALFALSITAFAPTASAQTTCATTPEQLWSIYQAGASAKVGKLMGGRYESWKATRLAPWDAEIMDRIWFATGDYAEDPTPPVIGKVGMRSRDLRSLDKLGDMIWKRCTNRASDPCANQYPGEAECMVFYSDRYSLLFQRAEQVKDDFRAGSFSNHLAVIAERLPKDFG